MLLVDIKTSVKIWQAIWLNVRKQ